jgi:hypothetical protein
MLVLVALGQPDCASQPGHPTADRITHVPHAMEDHHARAV